LRFIEDMLEGWRQLITDFPAIVTGLQLVTLAVVGLTLAMFANPITMWIGAISAIIVGLGWAYNKFSDLAEAVGGVGKLMTILADSAKFEFNRIEAYGTKLKLSLQLIFNGIQDAWQSAIINMSVAFGRWIDGIANSKAGVMLGMEGGNETAAANAGWETMDKITDQFVILSNALDATNETLSATNPHIAELADAWSGGDPIEVSLDPSTVSDLTNGGSNNPNGPDSDPAETKDFYETTADQFVSGLKASFTTALASGDWKGFLDSVLDSFTMGVISSFTEGLFAPVQDAIGGFMSGLFSGVGDMGGSLTGSLVSGAGEGGGGFLSSIGSFFGFADGGVVPTTPNSKSYADSVPAMLMPGELVVPKDQVDNFLNGAAGGGGGQTFNINVTGDVSRLTRSEIVKMMPQIAAGTNMLNKENNRR